MRHTRKLLITSETMKTTEPRPKERANLNARYYFWELNPGPLPDGRGSSGLMPLMTRPHVGDFARGAETTSAPQPRTQRLC